MNDKEKQLINNLKALRTDYPMVYKYIKSIVILIIIFPILIWGTYFIGDCGYVLINTSLEVGDALTFYGFILAFIGTVLLGALALWQNNKLSLINNDLIKQQYKPVITVSYLVDVADEKEKFRTYYRTIERNDKDIIVNNGFSSKPTYYPYAILSIKNIGLGPAVKCEVFWYNLDDVEGLNSLDEIKDIAIDNFYEKVSYSYFEYFENENIKRGPWLLFTEFDLGISEETNKLNLVFSFEKNVKVLHSILEIHYENLLGVKHKKLVYLAYENGEPSMFPVSKEYLVGGF